MLVAACAQGQAPAPSPGDRSVGPCQIAGAGFSAEKSAQLRALLESAQKGPLFAEASRAGLASCTAEVEDDRILRLVYRFRDQGRLSVTRDPRIEYTDQVFHVAGALSTQAVSVLAAAERAAFGNAGCGIDWGHAEGSSSRDTASAETVYRGESCSCRAGIRRDAAGNVVELSLRSTC